MAFKSVKDLLVAVTLFSIFANLLMLTGPLFMLQVYDRVLASGSIETLTALFHTFSWQIRVREQIPSMLFSRAICLPLAQRRLHNDLDVLRECLS